MLLVKTYSVLDTWTVEVSCVHGADPTQSHLLYRTQIRVVRQDLADAVEATSECIAFVARLLYQGELDDTMDCML